MSSDLPAARLPCRCVVTEGPEHGTLRHAMDASRRGAPHLERAAAGTTAAALGFDQVVLDQQAVVHSLSVVFFPSRLVAQVRPTRAAAALN